MPDRAVNRLDWDFYPDYEVRSCAAHIEAKRLANKFHRQWLHLGNRMSEEPLRASKLGEKVDRIRRQFLEIVRGLNRCCARYELHDL